MQFHDFFVEGKKIANIKEIVNKLCDLADFYLKNEHQGNCKQTLRFRGFLPEKKNRENRANIKKIVNKLCDFAEFYPRKKVVKNIYLTGNSNRAFFAKAVDFTLAQSPSLDK